MPQPCRSDAAGTHADGLTRRTALAGLMGMLVAAAGPPSRPIPGWIEVVAIVSNLDRAEAWLLEVAGWRRRWVGPTADAVLRHWGLPAGARGQERLLGNPGDDFGLVRLVALDGVGQQRRIRPAGMPWETGGLFSLMTRSRDAAAAFRRHLALGYDAFSEPADFDFGGVILRNVVLRGPDGINIAVYERVKPLLEGWPTITRLSAPFNAMMMVADRDRSTSFWTKQASLGLGVIAEGRFLDPAPGPNNFAIPANLVTRIPRPFAIMGEPGAETGRVEAMAFDGLSGRDFAAHARPPNFGLAMLRFRCPGHGRNPARIDPHGDFAISHRISPDGVIAELLHAMAP